MKIKTIIVLALAFSLTIGCGPTYQPKPLPITPPSASTNMVSAGDLAVSAKAYTDPDEAKNDFGFDVRKSGFLPVMVVFDNKGPLRYAINGDQTFMEDTALNLWQVLSREAAGERATRYVKTTQMAKDSAFWGLVGAAAGTLVGAAIGVVSGGNVGEAVGKGAAVGAVVGAISGGAGGYTSEDDRQAVIRDLREKTLANKQIEPHGISHGVLFFPGEIETAKTLRMQLKDLDSGQSLLIMIDFISPLPK